MAEELIELGAKKKGPRMPLARARELAQRLRRKIAPYAVFAEIAGSIRRRKPTVGDIELVVLPKMRVMFDIGTLWDLGFVGGDRIQRKVDRNGVKYEIYIAHKPEELGAMLLTYTGDFAFNIALRGIAKRQGWLLNQYGLFDAKSGEVILQSPYEEDFFGALGVDYHTPEERSIADRPGRKAKMGDAEWGAERRVVGYIGIELRQDPEDGWVLFVVRTDPYGGKPWEYETAFGDDEPEARRWYNSIQGDEDLDLLVRKTGHE